MPEKLQELAQRTIDELLKTLPPEKRLEGLSPEERVKGLSPEQLEELAQRLHAREREQQAEETRSADEIPPELDEWHWLLWGCTFLPGLQMLRLLLQFPRSRAALAEHLSKHLSAEQRAAGLSVEEMMDVVPREKILENLPWEVFLGAIPPERHRQRLSPELRVRLDRLVARFRPRDAGGATAQP
jgi:hypothetical protein